MAEEEDERFGLLKPGEAEPWRVLEFYSGIGGMRYSTIKAGVNARVVEAFDINDKANDVYQHNFYHRPFQGNIESLIAADLDRYGAHAWLLSPPCQPYTRQGLQKGSEDARASSFLVILELIPHIKEPPFLLFVENVVGFEASDTHRKMIELLIKADYVTQEFILSPLQFNIPYSRPRYFCLAKRKPLSFRCPQISHQLCCSPGPLIDENGRSDESSEESLSCCEQTWRYLEFQDGSSTTRTESDFLPTNSTLISDSVMLPKSEEESGSSLEMYYVPLSLVERWGSAMDIVYPDSTRCCCFTKSYYRYVKGTGSLLATVQPEVKGKASSLKTQKLRYFTPREVANLHSFPDDFQFPQHISLRQRYALLGNSLSVAVVASLLKYLFASPP